MQKADPAGKGRIKPLETRQSRRAEIDETQQKAKQQPESKKQQQQGYDVKDCVHQGLIEVVAQGLDASALIDSFLDVTSDRLIEGGGHIRVLHNDGQFLFIQLGGRYMYKLYTGLVDIFISLEVIEHHFIDALPLLHRTGQGCAQEQGKGKGKDRQAQTDG